MNDDDLMTAVRNSFTSVHVTTPVEQITRRGRALRARRRIPALAGALAVAAAAALAVTSLHPGTPRASHQPAAPLAAWTVARQSDGTIQVTLRELSNPAGLQRTLRAVGLPASVTLIGQQNPACRRYPASRSLLHSVVTHTWSSSWTSTLRPCPAAPACSWPARSPCSRPSPPTEARSEPRTPASRRTSYTPARNAPDSPARRRPPRSRSPPQPRRTR